jgi:hypothetical protein
VKLAYRASTDHLNLDGQCDFVFGAVDAEHPVNLDLGRTFRGYGAIHAVGNENDVRITSALQYIGVHAAVAPLVAALAASGIHYNMASNLAGRVIEMDRAAFQLETAVDGVERAAKGEVHGRVCGVELERDFLRERGYTGKHGYQHEGNE